MQRKKENSTPLDLDGEPGVVGSPVKGVTRLVRLAGRVLLWGCVLLLLVRGIASYLSSDSPPATTTRGATVTVTQPAGTEPSNAQRSDR